MILRKGFRNIDCVELPAALEKLYICDVASSCADCSFYRIFMRGCFAGDCLENGHDPPRHTFALRGGNVAEEGPDTIPLTKAAQKFQLLWRDDSAAPQNALGIYKAVAPPG